MKTLVTGGAGFLGSNLSQKLLDLGHEVIAVDNFITAGRQNVNLLKSRKNFTFIEHDITKPFPKLLTSHFSLLTSIYHLACPTGVDNLVRLAREMLLACSLGTINVLDLSKKTGAKVLFTSSSEAYGDPQVSPQSEEYRGNVDPTGIRSPYEEGKRFSETLVSMYVRKYDLDAKIVRVFNTYGPYMSERDSRVIPAFLRQAAANRPLTVHGKGEQRRTFCYADDLISGLILVAEYGERGKVYNLGGDEEITIADLANLLIELTGTDSKIEHVSRPPHDHQMRKPDLTKVKKLGWSQKISLEAGIKKTIESQKSK